MHNTKIQLFTIMFVALVLGGCSGTMKAIPKSEAGIAMGRSDYEVLSKVEGTSDETSILFGLIKVIDGDKLQLFFIPFFEEKYSYQSPPEGLFQKIIYGIFQPVGPEDRAYYKALAKTPDADSIIPKSSDIESSGIPILFNKKSVTYYGKAIKLKTDQELGR